MFSDVTKQALDAGIEGDEEEDPGTQQPVSDFLLGLREVPLADLLEPNKQYASYRVRPVDDKMVAQMQDNFLANGYSGVLLTVMEVEDSNKKLILDGNHR